MTVSLTTRAGVAENKTTEAVHQQHRFNLQSPALHLKLSVLMPFLGGGSSSLCARIAIRLLSTTATSRCTAAKGGTATLTVRPRCIGPGRTCRTPLGRCAPIPPRGFSRRTHPTRLFTESDWPRGQAEPAAPAPPHERSEMAADRQPRSAEHTGPDSRADRR